MQRTSDPAGTDGLVSGGVLRAGVWVFCLKGAKRQNRPLDFGAFSENAVHFRTNMVTA